MEIKTILGHEIAISRFNEDDEDKIISNINDEILNGANKGDLQIKDYTVRFKILDSGEYYLKELNKSLTIIESLLNEKIVDTGNKVSFYQTDDYFEELNDLELFEDLDYYNKAMFEACILDKNEETIDDMTTGRYCDIQSVYDELLAFMDEL